MSNTYLFHEKCRDGQIFDSSEVEKLMGQGWVDTPKKLSKLEEEVKEVKAETVEEAAKLPKEDLKSLFINRGLLAEIDDEVLVQILVSKGYHVESLEDQGLLARFYKSPSSLTKKELVELGKDHLLDLKMSMKEQTMIEKITEVLDQEG